MRDKVAVLNVVPVDRTGRPQANVIEQLEAMLARARSGELQSFHMAYVRANGRAAQAWAYGERDTDHDAIGGALITIQHQYVNMLELSEMPAPTSEEPA